MTSLAQVALSNAVMALPLAGMVWLVSRLWRRPAVVHTLWVLVLVKLLSPPLVTVPLPVAVAEPQPARAVDKTSAPQAPQAVLPAAGTVESGTAGSSGLQDSPGHWVFARDFNAGRWRAAQTPAFDWPMPILSTARVNLAADLLGAFTWIWVAGALLRLSREACRFLQFKRCVESLPEVEQVSAECAEVAAQLGLRTYPKAVVFEGICTPMLWGIGPCLRIVFPRPLWDRLSSPARKTLLAHELAHYARGDHWVRLLELFAGAAFWWHPVVNWARREIEAAEEECCDTWVVEAVSRNPRTYAEALLTTLDFIADTALLAPPASSPVRQVPLLEYRLQQIMRRAGSRSHTRQGRAIVASVCLFLLPLHPFPSLIPLVAEVSQPQPEEILPTSPLPILEQARRPTTSSGAAAPRQPEADEHPLSKRWTVLSPDRRYRLHLEGGHHVFLENRANRVRHDLTNAAITAAAFLPTSDRLLTGSADGTLCLHHCATGEPEAILGHIDGEITTVAVDAQGRTALSASGRGLIAVWDLDSKRKLQTWNSQYAVSAAGFSPTGLRIALSTTDSSQRQQCTLLLLDTSSLEPIATVSLTEPAAALEFASESEVLAATSDGTVWACDLLTSEVRPAGYRSPRNASLAGASPGVRFPR